MLQRLQRTAYLGLAALTLTSAVKADNTLSPYNVFVAGGFTDQSDCNGPLAVGGVLTTSNYNIGGALLGESISSLPGDATFVDAGGFSGQVEMASGNWYVGGTAGTLYNNGTGSKDSSDPLNFANLLSQYSGLSTTLSGMAQTAGDSCTGGAGGTTCTATGSGLNIINLSSGNAGLLGGSNTVNINGVSASNPLIINVAGSADSLTNASIFIDGHTIDGDSTNAVAQYVIFNFFQATTLNFTSVVGSVLAPNAAVTGKGGQFDGQLIANSFNGGTNSTEFHNLFYEGAFPLSAPEPAPMFAIGAGLIALAWRRPKRRV